MNGLKNSFLDFLFGKKKVSRTHVAVPEPLEVIPGVKAGSPHLRRVAIYIPRKNKEFYIDGQIVSNDGRGIRLVDVETGKSMSLSKDIFEFMFEQKEK